ncbi:GNAT family N-acetyltransferase [Brevibacillus laterosporus]|uniref:GNAT family N-acetyltransferase n=1 Tax=Brevibacillus laterosporus TaxID=1465 RepID=UPI000BCA84E2|nr:GNAT family N-acetyltransferase [Brevibacillus laterosporus]PCN42060.1 GNAT family N-acetyltransferase [Brevibacillus laterosporus]
MDISIRDAHQDDYESLLLLFRQVHDLHVFERPDLYKENPTPVGKEFFESQLIDVKQHIFVATIGLEIIGVVVTKEEDITENSFVNARKILFVNSLCVSKTYRNKGVGKRLMQYVIDFGGSLKVNSIELGVSENNASAILFYESIGMTTKSRKMELRLN